MRTTKAFSPLTKKDFAKSAKAQPFSGHCMVMIGLDML
jgi:hypothetical protein